MEISLYTQHLNSSTPSLFHHVLFADAVMKKKKAEEKVPELGKFILNNENYQRDSGNLQENEPPPLYQICAWIVLAFDRSARSTSLS